MNKPQAIVALPGEGEYLRGPVGGPLTMKARGAQTGGRVTAFENVIPPNEGPPLHLHHEVDEMWFVIEGDLRFRIGDGLSQAPAGTFVFIPRRTPHCFQNSGSDPARILVTFTPAGMETFFDRVSDLAAVPIEPEVYRALAAEAEMEIVGPPLAISHPLD